MEDSIRVADSMLEVDILRYSQMGAEEAGTCYGDPSLASATASDLVGVFPCGAAILTDGGYLGVFAVVDTSIVPLGRHEEYLWIRV